MTEQNQRIEDVLETQGMYVSTTVGVSMYPMLRDRRDTVVISPCKGILQKYDVPLYRRGHNYFLSPGDRASAGISFLPCGFFVQIDEMM